MNIQAYKWLYAALHIIRVCRCMIWRKRVSGLQSDGHRLLVNAFFNLNMITYLKAHFVLEIVCSPGPAYHGPALCTTNSPRNECLPACFALHPADGCLPAAGRSSRQETGPVDLYAAASAAAWSHDAQPNDRPPAPGPVAQPGPAARPVIPSSGLVTHPAQRNAAASAAHVATPPGSTLPVSGSAATQHAPCPTLAYEAAYTPPEQLQQRQQASAVIPRVGSAVASSTTALPSAAAAVHGTATVNLSNGVANNGDVGATAATRGSTLPGQYTQSLQSAPVHNQILARHPSGTSR